METYMKIVDYGELVERKWTANDGTEKTISSVELQLTNGIDTLVAEATDDLARTICAELAKDTLYKNKMYRCRLVFAVRKSKNKELLFNSIRLADIRTLV